MTDMNILSIIQQLGREPAAEIARRVGLATSAVHERLKKLVNRGVISEVTARIAPASLGYGLLAFVNVRTGERPVSRTTVSGLAAIPEVLEVHDVAGPDCYLLKIVARDVAHLHQIVRDRIGAVADVQSTTTTIVMATHKDTTNLPIAAGRRREPPGKQAAPARPPKAAGPAARSRRNAGPGS